MVAIREFPTPQNVKEVRQFVGLASYYRRFVQSFAQTAQPLHALTRKGVSFRWTESCQNAFDVLKKKLCEAPILAYPAFDREITLETDASILGIGAILSQLQADGKPHPVAFASRALSPTEQNYAITDLETLGVVWAVSHFRTYLNGQKVTIFTDHAAVKAVLQNPNASGKHTRWWTKVYGSGMKEVHITYRAGRENAAADALSRSPQGPSEGIAESEVQVSTIVHSPSDDFGELMLWEPETREAGLSETIALEQNKDDQLQQMIEYLETEQLPTDPKRSRKVAAQATLFTQLDGILYFLDPKRQFKKRVVVPRHLREKLMEDMHGGPLAGHFSTNRLYNTLIRTWWWEGMYKDVDYHCKSCPECAIVTGAGRPGRPPLKPIPVNRPFQIFGVDIIDLPKTERGNKHVIVFQDFLSKWPIVFPLPDQKTTRIVKLLVEEIVPVFGVPEAILSDRGLD